MLKQSMAAAAASVILALSLGSCSNAGTPDAAKRGGVVAAVMAALHDSDAEKLAALAGPSPADPADAAPILAQWAGVSDQDYSVSYQEGMGPGHVGVRVRAAGKTHQPVLVEFNMSWSNGHWMLGIGHSSAPSGPSHPAQATQPRN
jgi:hypothetical protein